jgi:predicted ATPase with chaperone activity
MGQLTPRDLKQLLENVSKLLADNIDLRARVRTLEATVNAPRTKTKKQQLVTDGVLVE